MNGESKAGFVRQSRKFEGNPLKEMPELFDAALTEFSEKTFDEASLNNIIKAAGTNKGSFYYRFSDKTDLYLCLLDKISEDKARYFANKTTSREFPEDFFEQLRYLCSTGMEYALHEPRFNKLWKRFLTEKPAIREIVRKAFPINSFDILDTMISQAYDRGTFDRSLSQDFIKGLIGLILDHSDALIRGDMTEGDINRMVDQLMAALKNGIAAKNK